MSARVSWLTVVFAAASMLLLWKSFSLSIASASVPRVVLIVTLLLLFLQLISELKGPPEAKVLAQCYPQEQSWRRILTAISWLILLLLFTWIFGVVLGNTLFCVAWLRLHASDSWWTSISMSTGLGGSLWLIFPLLLNVQLYAGLLWH